MPRLANDAIISHYIDGRIYNQQILLTTHWRLSVTGGTDVDMDALFLAVHTAFEQTGKLHEAYANAISENVVDITNRYQALYPIRYAYRDHATSFGNGNKAGPVPATNVAVAINLRADATGPGTHGVKHIGGLVAADMNNGSLPDASVGAFFDLGVELVTVLENVDVEGTDVNLVPVIFKRATPAASHVAVDQNVSNTIRTLRRRTLQLGS